MQQQQQQLFRALVPAVDPAEPRTARCWEWVCNALVNKDKGECTVSVLDTVFIEKQQIWSWFYSTTGGVIRKKPRAQLSVEAVQHAFSRSTTATSNALRASPVALCWFGDQIRTLQLFGEHELLTFLNAIASSDSSACLSAFVAPRGGDVDPTKYANLEHEFILSKTGRPQHKLVRLALGSQRITSMDARMNALVNDVVQHYVSFVEKSKRVRVVRCVSLFVLDDAGHLFLWRTDAFETVAASSSVAPASGHVLDASASLSHIQQQPRVYDGPHAVNERILTRAKAEAMRKPDERLVDAILSAPTPQQKRLTLLGASTSTPSLRDAVADSSLDPLHDDQPSQLRNARDWDDALQYLPASSTLSRGRRRTISAAHLVSSQKRGCCGDYCHIELSQLASKRMVNSSSKSGSGSSALATGTVPGGNATRSRALPHPLVSSSTAAATLDATDARRRSSVFTATAAANAFLESRASDESLQFQPRVGNARSSSISESTAVKPSSPQRQQHAESQQFAIPFKLVAQTRAEKQLVDLFVRRYHNGEDGAYLAEAFYGDGEPLGQTFPGYYYQEVRVCRNCFEFYTLIERVRMRAQHQIAKTRGAAASVVSATNVVGLDAVAPCSKNKSKRDRYSSATLQAAASSSVAPLASSDALREMLDELGDSDAQARRIASRIWRHAQTVSLAGLSKRDAAELYSFPSPHPAVAMVRSCLAIVLLGRNSSSGSNDDWTDLKRTVPPEKLLTRLQALELDDLRPESVMRAAAHARNPLFAPAHIAPVSSCAARFCDWILATLQAYAWQHERALNDRETTRVLRHLKPELLPVSLPAAADDNRNGNNSSVPVAASAPASLHSLSEASATTRSTRQKDAARRAVQAQQMARLAAPTALLAETDAAHAVFTCADGVTTVPYAVAGQAAGASSKCNLVVFHDIFDTLDGTQLFFRAVLARNVGARALFFNVPGQAGTSYAAGDLPLPSSASLASPADRVVLNNTWQAQRVHELLSHVDRTHAFPLHGAPFHVVGFGNGANLAACYAILHGRTYGRALQSLALVNGFASVDAQLAAVLHSAANVFACFPPARPDLPVTFFSRFLFSDAYLAKTDANLALSIYTAVTNAITLDGRIRLCHGALLHSDLTAQLDAIDVPLVLVQSVENALVAPTNVDPFLQGRTPVLHAWSHQQPSDVRGKTRAQLQHVLSTRHSAFVAWLRAGHELRQECKAYVTDLMELLVTSHEMPTESVASSGAAELEPILERSVPAAAIAPTAAVSMPLAAIAESSRREASRVAATSTSTPSAVIAARYALPSLDTPVVDVPRQVAASASSSAVAAASTIAQRVEVRQAVHTPSLSPFELELERSEREFQDAVRTHEAQKAALEKQRWIAAQAARSVPAAQALASPSAAITATAAAVATREPTAFNVASRRAPPSLPAVVSVQSTSTAVATLTTPGLTIDPEIDALRHKLLAHEQRVALDAEQLRAKQRAAADERMAALQREQEQRRRAWDDEDRARLAALEHARQDEQRARLAAASTRSRELLQTDATSTLATVDDQPTAVALAAPPSTLRQQLEQQQQQRMMLKGAIGTSSDDIRAQLRAQPELPSMLEQLEAEERVRKRVGLLRVDEFANVRASMQQSYRDGVRDHEKAQVSERTRREHTSATRIQTLVRRFVAVRRVAARRTLVQRERITQFAGGEIVRVVRGFLGRRRFVRCRAGRIEGKRRAAAAVTIQRLVRGHLCRVVYKHSLRAVKALVLQRVYRGHAGRSLCRALRDEIAQQRYLHRHAAVIQATWRMHVARNAFLSQRVEALAALELQRVFRGHVGRTEAARKRQWRDAEPGPERLALGLQLIEGSKAAFERQQREIDALHRAHEATERQVSAVHTDLRASEQELAVLERELHELDALESDLRELTHEAELLHSGGVGGLLRASHSGTVALSPSSTKPSAALGSGVPTTSPIGADNSSSDAPIVLYAPGVERSFEHRATASQRQADAYAVEMAIAIKRAERERRKQDLAAEFASVFADVERKRLALSDMERALADMEATRMRKDRECARLQRHLMELLEEQKLELERLREKGIELETATATSAAAAAATAAKAKAHEARSQAMFASTEELMKFQFMSMSLSYFSSLSMLKNLRDINADTTASAITTTAETAATAAAAAAAANIPAMDRLKVGAADLVTAASQLKQQQLADRRADAAAAERMQLQPLPPDAHDWSVDDVGRWLDSLALPQYKRAFAEGAVDGAFLLELRPEDLADVLGVSHALHVRKLVVARNKLLPLTAHERMQLAAVEHEADASATRHAPPDRDTVFSQARNGRLKRLVESLDAGFPIDDEDDKGNTLLLLACQNVNTKMVELLVARRANVNHRNAQGNTPLHFAMAYDTNGALGEYLIARGADDTIENALGLTPYDGLTAE